MWQLESIIVFGGVYLILGRKFHGSIDGIIRIIGWTPLPISLGNIEDTIIYRIEGKVKLVVLLEYIRKTPCLFYS